MTDPSVVRSLAISADDLVAAVEASARDAQTVVLRATPPYSGRMRARIHVVQPDEADDETLHVDPSDVLRESAPLFPTPDLTEDELRTSESESYSVERHRTYHEQRVSEWRESLPEYVVERVELPAVGREVRIGLLGP